MSESFVAASAKLPKEAEHYVAQMRMRALAPYYEWVKRLLAPWIGTRVLDAGCGIGNFVAAIEADAELVVGVDLSPTNLELLQARFESSPRVQILQVDLEESLDQLKAMHLDTFVSLDVLEHLEDDRQALAVAYDILAPGGHLLIKVPAGPWLYGAVDEASAHFRRYGRADLRAKVEAAGFEVLHLRYMNVAGVLPYWWKSRVRRRTGAFSSTFKPWQLTAIRLAMPVLQLVDRICGPPAGLSLVLAARKA